MTIELPYAQLTDEQRNQVAARFRDDLFGVDSSAYIYQFTPGGLFRRPVVLEKRSNTRANKNPRVVVIETGKPVITEAVMDILIRAYFSQGATTP